jgi:hypothetical protein
MKTTPKTETVRYPTLFRRNSHQSVEFRRGVRWGRWPVALARTQAFLQRFGLASLQDLTATLLASNRPAMEPLI